MPTITMFTHRLMIKRESVNDVLALLREHGIEAQAWGIDIHRDREAIDWTSSQQDVDLDFLRPKYLPPRNA